MEKLYFNKNIFTLYLKLLIKIENANQSCKLFDNNAAVEIDCEFSLLQYLFTALRDFTESSRSNKKDAKSSLLFFL